MAEKIPDPVVADERNFVDKNPGSMFLTAVDEREILDFVNKCKSKTSTDRDDIDMYIVKKIPPKEGLNVRKYSLRPFGGVTLFARSLFSKKYRSTSFRVCGKYNLSLRSFIIFQHRKTPLESLLIKLPNRVLIL